MTTTDSITAAIAHIEGVEHTNGTYFRFFGYTSYITLNPMRVPGVVQVSIKYNRRTNNKSFSDTAAAVAHVARWSKRIKGDLELSAKLDADYKARKGAELELIKSAIAAAGYGYVQHYMSHCVKLPGIETPQPVHVRGASVCMELRIADIARSVPLEQAAKIIFDVL